MLRTISLAAAAALACAATACSEPTVSNETGAKLSLAAPADRTVAPGETCEVDIAVARKGFDGPIGIEFEGLPSGVSVVETELAIPAGRDDAKFTLHAENDAAPVEDRLVTVTAATDTGMSVSDRFRLRVTGKN